MVLRDSVSNNQKRNSFGNMTIPPSQAHNDDDSNCSALPLITMSRTYELHGSFAALHMTRMGSGRLFETRRSPPERRASTNIPMNRLRRKCRHTDRDILCAALIRSRVTNPFTRGREEALSSLHFSRSGAGYNPHQTMQHHSVFIKLGSLAR